MKIKSAFIFVFFVFCSSNLFSQSWLWAKNAGGGLYTDEGYSVSTDAAGNVFVAGTFNSLNITFGSITLTNADSSGYTYSVFIAKYDANGNVLWAKNSIAQHL